MELVEKIKGNAFLFKNSLYYTQDESGWVVSAGSGEVERHCFFAAVETEQAAQNLISVIKGTIDWILTEG